MFESDRDGATRGRRRNQASTPGDKRKQPKRRRSSGFIALEPRMMFDAAAATTAVVVADHADASNAAAVAAAEPVSAPTQSGGGSFSPAVAEASGNSGAGQTPHQDSKASSATAELPASGPVTAGAAREVVFIDSNVADRQTLVNGLKAGTELFVLDPTRDGLQQIADILAANDFHDLSAIQIVSHGSDGAITLGSTVLNAGSLADHAQLLTAIGASLSADGDIMLYGCDVAQSEAGLQFIGRLAEQTRADVAASTDPTGSAALGGDWVLEASTGAIEAGVAFSAETQALWSHLLAPTVSATQTSALVIDNDSDGVADPGDTVAIDVVINNTGPDGATDVSLDEILNGLTFVPGTVNVSPLAFDDSYTAVGNTLMEVGNATAQTGPQSSVAGSVVANDTEFLGDTFQISLVNATAPVSGFATITTTNGGSVVMDTEGADMGSFTYISAAGFTGPDTFTYTLRDDGRDAIFGNTDDLTGVGTVTITVSNRVWYVNNAAVSGGDGRSTSPFDSLADVTGAAGPDLAGDIIFLHTGSGAYTGGITLLNDQTLWGRNELLTVGGYDLFAAGSDPIITNPGGSGVTLAQGNTLKGFTVGDTLVSDITDGAGTVGALTISNVNLTGLGQAVDIDQGGVLNVTIDSLTSTSGANGVQLAATGAALTGGFTVTTGAISGSTGSAFLVGDGLGGANTGGSLTITYGGTIASSGTARTVEITDHSAGGITLSGDITQTAGNAIGIFLNDNSGNVTFSGASIALAYIAGADGVNISNHASGTIQFSNALDIDATSGSGILLANNGTSVINFLGGGNGVDISSTLAGGTAFTAINGGTVTVQGSSNSIDSSLGRALNLNGVTVGSGGITFATTNSGGGANNVNLTNVTGTGAVNLGGGALSGASGVAFNVSGGTGSIDFNGSITHAGNARAIDIQNHAGGAISFDGTVTSNTNSDGIFLDNNDGAAIAFTNTLTINTSASNSAGFTAINGGTVTATASANTINSGQGTALRVEDTTIGAADLIFRSIASSGGSATGIILSNTGSGGLHVTGTGSAGSGGTIANKSGADGQTATGIGIYLNNASDVQLDWMQLNGLSNFGILGNNVTGFSFDNSVISGTNGTAAGAFDEAAISFTNLLGSASISDSNIGNGFEFILKVLNNSGTLNRLTIDNTDFGTNNNALGGDAVQIVAMNSATVNVTVTDSGFTNARGDLFNAAATQTADMDVVFRDNTLSNNHANKVSAASNILVFSTSNGDVTYDISHNTLTTGATGSAIAAAKGVPDTGSGGTMIGTINANTIGVAGVDGSGSEFTGIFASALGSGTHTTAITNNVIRHYGEEGIFLKANDSLTGGNSVLNATLTGNLVEEPDALAFAGLWVVAGSGSGVENNVVNVVLGSSSAAAVAGSPTGSLQNDFTEGDPANGSDVFLQESGSGSVINLSRAGSAAGTVAGVVADDNVGTPSVVAVGTVNLVNTLPATPPPVAPLLAAPDGVEAASTETSDPLPPAVQPASNDPAPADASAGNSELLPVEGDPNPPATGTAATTPIVNDGVLSQAELDFLVDAAIDRWMTSGLTAEQLTVLNSFAYTVADMPGLYLGSFAPGRITLDSDAAGYGWFIDATPQADSEFGNALAATQLLTDPNGAPAGHIDLLTTVMHEMGHALGLEDSYTLTDRASLMYGFLVTGERRLPGQGQADGAVAGSITSEEFVASSFATIGALPANKSVTVRFNVTVDPQTNKLIDDATYQAQVSGSNFAAVQSAQATLDIDSLTLGGTVWNDNGAGGGGVAADGLKNGTEPGVNGVLVTLFADNGTTAGTWDASDTSLGSTTTAGGGDYTFNNLAPGEYIVRIDGDNFDAGNNTSLFTPGLVNSSVTSPEPIDPDFGPNGVAGGGDDNRDNDDNGARVLGQPAYSNAITLAYNTEPTDGTSNDTNTTLDFGFFANVKPSLDSVAATASYTENASGTILSSGLTVTDANDANLQSATVTITDFVTGDVLAVNVGATGITFDYTAGVLTLTGPASKAAFEQVLRTVAYSSSSDNPTVFGGDAQRTIQWRLNDGQPVDNLSDIDTTTVTITASNDAPVVAGAGGSVGYTEQAAAVLIDADLTVSDADNTNLTGATVRISGGLQPGDTLSFVPPGGSGITGTYASGVLTLTGTSSVANYQTALRSVTFANTTNDNPTVFGAVPNRTIDWQVSDGTPAAGPLFSAATEFSANTDRHANALADLDNDGDLDVVVANAGGNKVTVYLGNGSGGFGAGTDIPVGTFPKSIAAGDVDGDGDRDLLVANRDSDTISVLLNNGAGAFTAAPVPTVTVGDEPQSVATGDFNGDGKLDFAVANGGSNAVSIRLGNGDGSFTAAAAVGTPAAVFVAVGDLNGDGKLDLAWAKGSVEVAFGNGNGGFGAVTGYAVGGSANMVAIGDLNGDGTADLVATTTPGDTVAVLLGTGGGVFGPAANFGTGGTSPNFVAIGELNGDGKLDLVVANGNSGGGGLLLGNGDGTFGPATNFSIPHNPTSVGIGDLNGLGGPDLLYTYSHQFGQGGFGVTLNSATSFSNVQHSTVAITAVNDAPENTKPGTQNVSEDGSLVFSTGNGNAISIADADVGPGTETVTLAANNGALTLSQTTGLTFGAGDGSADTTMTFTGTVADVNAALSGLTYAPVPDFYGSDTLTITTNDNGNTGTDPGVGGTGTATTEEDVDTVTINVAAVNDAPEATITPPTYGTTPGVALNLKNNGLAVSDPDSAGADVTVTLSVSSGNLTVAAGGSGVTSVTGSGTPSVTIIGTAAEIHALLTNDGSSTVSYLNNVGGSATLTLAINDNGNTGGGDLTASDTATINVDQPPQLLDAGGTVGYTEQQASPQVIDSDIQVFDADAPAAGNQINKAVIQITGGAFAGDILDWPDVAVPAASNGSWDAGTFTLTLNGPDTMANFQQILRQVTFASTSDNPTNGGANPTRTVTWTIYDIFDVPSTPVTSTIDVTAVNDAPDTTVPGGQTTNEDTSKVFSIGNGNAIVIADIDGGTGNESVTLSVQHGTLTYSALVGSATLSGGANSSATFTLTGSTADLTATLNGLTYAPVSDYNGPDTLTVATNDNGNTGAGSLTDSDTVAITITAVADTATDSLTTTEDTAVTANVITGASGGSADNFENAGRVLTAASNGAHGTVGFAADGTVTYTPDADFYGSDSFTYTVTSGGVTENGTVNVTISAVGDTATDSLTTAEDTAVTANVLTGANGASADNFENSGRTVTAVSQGAHGGVSFAADGTVTYTPDADYVGSDSFSYTVTSNGVTETGTVNVTVTAVADVETDILITNEDTAITANVLTGTNGASADNFEGPASITAVTNGANGSVSFLATGEVTYTPDADFNGTDSFTYTVTANGTTEIGTVNVTINAVADTVTDNLTTTEDTAIIANVLTGTNGASADNFENGTRTVTAVTQGAHGGVSFAANGDVTYTPDADFHGTDAFTYTVTSGGVTEIGTVNVTVNAVADAVTDNLTTNEDTAIIANVLTGTNGASADNFENGLRVVSAVTQGAHGAVSFAANGDVTYTPDADFNGTDSFTYTVTSNGATETGTVNVTVNAVADVVADALTTNEDTAVTANVLTGTNGASADNFEDGGRVLTAVTQGTNGSVTFLANGSVTYTPNADFNGTDSFTYTVTSAGTTETATVSVTVNAVNDAPVVAAGNTVPFDANEGDPVAVSPGILVSDVDSATLTGATVAITAGRSAGDSLNFTNQSGITGSYDPATGVLTLTGNASLAAYQAALASVTFDSTSQKDDPRTVSWTVNDGSALSAVATTTITVRSRIDGPHDHGNHHGHHDRGDDRGNDRGHYGDTRLRTDVSDHDSGGGFGRSSGYYFVKADVRLTSAATPGIQIELAVNELIAALAGDVVSVIALQANGDPLPSWLSFNPATGQFAGLPPNGMVASIPDDIVTGAIPGDRGVVTPTGQRGQPTTITVLVVARDSRGNVAVSSFTIDLRASGRQGWNLPLNGDWGREARALEAPRDLASLGIDRDLAWLAEWSEPRSSAALSADAGEISQRVGFGRAGFSQQLQSVGWRAAQAERMALLNSLPRATLH